MNSGKRQEVIKSQQSPQLNKSNDESFLQETPKFGDNNESINQDQQNFEINIYPQEYQQDTYVQYQKQNGSQQKNCFQKNDSIVSQQPIFEVEQMNYEQKVTPCNNMNVNQANDFTFNTPQNDITNNSLVVQMENLQVNNMISSQVNITYQHDKNSQKRLQCIVQQQMIKNSKVINKQMLEKWYENDMNVSIPDSFSDNSENSIEDEIVNEEIIQETNNQQVYKESQKIQSKKERMEFLESQTQKFFRTMLNIKREIS